MKRTWIGIALLSVLFAGGLWLGEHMEKTLLPGAADLEKAAQLALTEEWDKAEALLTRTQKNWQKNRPVTASVADHEPMEDIESMLEELEIYAKLRDTASFSAGCMFLSKQMEALAKSHSFSLPHLL